MTASVMMASRFRWWSGGRPVEKRCMSPSACVDVVGASLVATGYDQWLAMSTGIRLRDQRISGILIQWLTMSTGIRLRDQEFFGSFIPVASDIHWNKICGLGNFGIVSSGYRYPLAAAMLVRWLGSS